MTAVLAVPCIRCHHAVWWDRVGSSFRLMEGRSAHACPGDLPAPVKPPRKTCGAWLPLAEDTCDRVSDHRGKHRRRRTMQNDASQRRRWRTIRRSARTDSKRATGWGLDTPARPAA